MLPVHSDHSPIPVDVARLLDDGHIFVPIAPDNSELGRGIANRMVYPPLRNHSVLSVIGGADYAILASHCIDAQGAELLLNRKFDDFLVRRAAALSDIISNHVQRRALFGFRDGPDVSTLFDDVVDDVDAE
jgi:hypothetical protein